MSVTLASMIKEACIARKLALEILVDGDCVLCPADLDCSIPFEKGRLGLP
jgi:ketosteroid isomerase-like protein